MIADESRINRYGAKFFIGQLVRVVADAHDVFDEDRGKVGVVDGISESTQVGGRRCFSYSLSPTSTRMTAWYDERDLDFVVSVERDEWNSNGAALRKDGGGR